MWNVDRRRRRSRGAGLLGTLMMIVLVAIVAAVGWAVYARVQEMGDKAGAGGRAGGGGGGRGDAGPAPVAVAAVERGAIELRRVYSGTLEPAAEFVVAPKIGGRIQKLAVDLADRVERGQVVAQLDDDEFRQQVAQAEAEVAVAGANIAEAKNALAIADRELKRIEQLRERGVASESELDVARADQLAKSAAVDVATAQATRAQAMLEAAKIRLGYATVTANWSGDDAARVVAERYLDEGETVSANTPLMRIVSLDPIKAVVFATEKDYGRLATGQTVTLTTDAYADRSFTGTIARIAPVFRQTSRQARIEMTVANGEGLLKPGMFVRAAVVLDRAEDATIVPVDALVLREGVDGVFVVGEAGDKAAWRTVKLGIRDGERQQVIGEGLSGRVVTLGQQLITDGSAITIPEPARGGGGKPTPAAEAPR